MLLTPFAKLLHVVRPECNSAQPDFDFERRRLRYFVAVAETRALRSNGQGAVESVFPSGASPTEKSRDV